MRKILILLPVLCIALAAPGTAAEILYRHTWVSNSGHDDSVNCDISAPCATFTGAYAKTNVGGEITCLNGGNYGAANIIKSITINCDAAIGSNVYSNEVYTLSVNIAAADVVTLRGLDIDGAGFVGDGTGIITFQGAGTLRLEKMKVSNLRGSYSGVYFAPTGPAKLEAVDSIVAHNGGSALGAGIYVKPASGVTANISIERTVVANNNFGIFADATGGGIIKGVVIDSIVTGNTNHGITVSSSGALAVLMIDNTKVANNGYGLVAGGGAAAMLVRHSTVVNNGTGLYVSGGGNLYSYRDNSVNLNTPGGDGAFTQFLSLQ